VAAQQAERQVADKVQADDEHHQQPGVERIDHLVRSVGLVGQDRQHHQGDQQEADDGVELVVADALHHLVQRLFPVQQQNHDAAEHHGMGLVAGDTGGAEQKHSRGREHRGGAQRAVAIPGRPADPVHHHDCGDGGQADSHEPAAPEVGEQAGHAPQGADQRERAQADELVGRAFPLETHQKAQGYRQHQADELGVEIVDHGRRSASRGVLAIPADGVQGCFTHAEHQPAERTRWPGNSAQVPQVPSRSL
jgi:hypothetical protein